MERMNVCFPFQTMGQEVEVLDETEREAGGFGHTGV